MLEGLRKKWSNHKIYKEWRRRNSHNYTGIEGLVNIDLISVGRETYGTIQVLNFSSDYELKIGNFVSIAPNVMFLVCSDHSIDTISTFPYKVKCLNKEKYEAKSKGNIIVDDDVWISYGAIILSGVHIGQGAVIAAGAVVTKDVPAYAIVGGCPAKLINYRFDEELRSELVKIDYSLVTKEMVETHIEDLYKNLKLVDQFKWMPKH